MPPGRAPIGEVALEGLGSFAGSFVNKQLEKLSQEVAKYDLVVLGADSLKEVPSDKPFILCMNHIGPRELDGKEVPPHFGAMPDRFIAERVIRENTSRESTFIMKATIENFLIEKFGEEKGLAIQKKLKPLSIGLSTAIGGIPVDTTPDRFNRRLIQDVRKALEEKKAIIVLGEAVWRNTDYNFDKGIELKTSTATFSSRYGIPVIPAYVYCPEGFKKDPPVGINIGKPIYPESKERDTITQEISAQIVQLQKDLQTKAPQLFKK